VARGDAVTETGLPASPTQRTAAALLSRSFAYDADVLPLSYDGSALTVGVAVQSTELLERIRQLTRKDINAVMVPVREIREGLKALYPAAVLRDVDSQAAQTLDEMFSAAIAGYASDVHVEPVEGRSGRVRLDIDGVLQHERTLEPGLFERVVSLIKVRSNMNTGESRVPQDGRLSVSFDGRPFDVRTSTIPVGGLEKVVLRFLQRFDLVPDLEQLGMSAESLGRYHRSLKRPGSFCVIAGPTGSGKSTTAYASLQTINLESANICSVEDPIECRIPGVAQIAVNEKTGMTFPIALRALLRQNPQHLFVGELRDAETASIALQASLTGISLITTLHARDALRVAARMTELGANRSTLASSLTLAVSQRLVRMLCRRCKIKTSVSSQALAVARRYGFVLAVDAWDAHGCEACAFTGFQGRIGAFEVLEIKPELATAIERCETPAELGKIAFGVGYKPMIVDALRHVASGATSEGEILRHLSYDDAE
jgi:type II secretory ATPase GspE/PulE/Tfp pilus assembly ATPase PilB-like protein